MPALSELIFKQVDVNYECIELVINRKPIELLCGKLCDHSIIYGSLSQTFDEDGFSLKESSMLGTPISEYTNNVNIFRIDAEKNNINIPLSKWYKEITAPDAQIKHIINEWF